MGIVDAEIFGESGLANANGLGLGVLFAFRSSDTFTSDWTSAFAIGLAYMRDTNANRLRDDFVLNQKAPVRDGEYLVPQFVDTSAHSVLVVVTYSFGRRPKIE